MNEDLTLNPIKILVVNYFKENKTKNIVRQHDKKLYN